LNPQESNYSLDAVINGNCISANQNLFIRHQPDGQSRVLWAIHNLNELLFDGERVVVSGVFALRDGSTWYMQLQPRNEYENGNYYSSISLHPVATPEEREELEGGL